MFMSIKHGKTSHRTVNSSSHTRDGSIVVKEANRPGKDYVGLIAIMRKKAGVDPDHNDWEFIEYVRNAADAEFRVIAEDGVCWGCHARVEDIDYVFTELD